MALKEANDHAVNYLLLTALRIDSIPKIQSFFELSLPAELREAQVQGNLMRLTEQIDASYSLLNTRVTFTDSVKDIKLKNLRWRSEFYITLAESMRQYERTFLIKLIGNE